MPGNTQEGFHRVIRFFRVGVILQIIDSRSYNKTNVKIDSQSCIHQRCHITKDNEGNLK